MTLLGRFSGVLAVVLVLSGVAEAGRTTTSRFVVVRSRATMAAAPVGRLAAGVSVSVVRKQGAWALVRWSGSQGWIRTSALAGAKSEDESPFARRGIKAKSTASERKLAKRAPAVEPDDEEAEDEEVEAAPAPRKGSKKLTKKEQLAIERAEALARAKKLAQERAKALAEAEAQALAEAEDIKRQMGEDDEESEDEEAAAPRKKGTAKVKTSERTAMAASSEKPAKNGWGSKKSRMAPAEEADEEAAEDEEEELSAADQAAADDDENPLAKSPKDKKAAAKAKKEAEARAKAEAKARKEAERRAAEEEQAAEEEEREEREERAAAKSKKGKKGKRGREAAFAADEAAADIAEEDMAEDDDDEAPSARVRKRGMVDSGRKGLRIAVGSDLGYQMIQHQFVSNARNDGANFLPNYSLAAGAASVGIGARASYPLGPVRAGLAFRYAYGYSSGLKVPVNNGSETLAMATQLFEATGTAAYPLMRGRLSIAGALGYGRYGTTIADGKLAVLPSEVISGLLVGVGADAPNLFAKIGGRVHLEALPVASIAQNRGREEGASSSTLGFGAGLLLYRPIAMKGKLRAQLGYDFRYTITKFSGNANRIQANQAQRAMAAHALVLGIGWEL